MRTTLKSRPVRGVPGRREVKTRVSAAPATTTSPAAGRSHFRRFIRGNLTTKPADCPLAPPRPFLEKKGRTRYTWSLRSCKERITHEPHEKGRPSPRPPGRPGGCPPGRGGEDGGEQAPALLQEMADGGRRLHHLAQGEGCLPPAHERPRARPLRRRLLEGPEPGPGVADEQGQGRALPPHRLRQQDLRPRPPLRGLALGDGAHLHHPRRAEADPEVREREPALPDRHLVLRGHGRVQPAQRLQRRLLQGIRRRGLQAVLTGPGRAPEADAQLLGRHDGFPGRLRRPRRYRHQRRRGLPDAHPQRLLHRHGPLDPLRHPHRQEHPGCGLREGQGRLRRQAPQVQGHHRGRVHGQLHLERRPRPGLPGTPRAGPSSTTSSSPPSSASRRTAGSTGRSSTSTASSPTLRGAWSTSSTGPSPSSSASPSS